VKPGKEKSWNDEEKNVKQSCMTAQAVLRMGLKEGVFYQKTFGRRIGRRLLKANQGENFKSNPQRMLGSGYSPIARSFRTNSIFASVDITSNIRQTAEWQYWRFQYFYESHSHFLGTI